MIICISFLKEFKDDHDSTWIEIAEEIKEMVWAPLLFICIFLMILKGTQRMINNILEFILKLVKEFT
jgi:hypothetical protein